MSEHNSCEIPIENGIYEVSRVFDPRRTLASLMSERLAGKMNLSGAASQPLPLTESSASVYNNIGGVGPARDEA